MPDSCGGCMFYHGRHADDAALKRAEEAGHPFPPGRCRRYPAAVAKQPDDWCGEWHLAPAQAKPVKKGR